MKNRWSFLLAAWLLALPALAADWPQWQGPKRDNISEETGLLHAWPQGGPKLLWTATDAGAGFSGPAIVGTRLFSMGGWSGKEYVFCNSTIDGKRLWATEIGPFFTNGFGNGPRCTPTVDGTFVYALGAEGDLVCVEKASGKKIWHKNFKSDFGGSQMSGWGYSESPLIDGDKLVCTPGGGKGSVVALDKKTGKQLWRSTALKDKAAYTSLIVAEPGGVRQYIAVTGKGAAGIAASDGKMLWYQAEGGFKVAVCPTPIYSDGFVFITADYGFGCNLLKVAGGKATSIYANKTMENHHGGVVLVKGHLYGCSGNTNTGPTFWRCLDFKSGRLTWNEARKLEGGSLTCADGQLYLFGQNTGTAVLLDADPTGWKEKGRFKIPRQTRIPRGKGKIWTHPVVANGKLYLRDNDLLFCYDVKGESSASADKPGE